MAYYKLLMLIYSCSFLGFTTSIDTIKANQSLHDSDTLVSNGETFKLGFFSPPNSSYRYVGVMFNLPVMTTIWIANRDKPLNDSKGSMEISSDGNLVLLDGQKAVVWSTNLSDSGSVNSSVVLLDTGNLVLQDNSNNSNNNNTYTWESFEHPSNSLVQNMRIFTDSSTNRTNKLTAWRSPSDPASGRFTGTIEPAEIPEFFVWKEGEPYWRSGPWNGQIFSGIPYMGSFYKRGFDVASDPPRSAYLNFTNVDSSVLLYYMLGLSGALFEKTWSDEKGQWVVTWASMASECDVYGKCGPFGQCDAQGRPICRCLRGFVAKRNEEWKAGNWSGGCTRRMSLGCERKSEKEDGFLKIEKVKWPHHYKWFPTMEEGCRRQCLDNCSCVAYGFSAGIGCVLWDDDLVDVQKLPDGGLDLYIRLPLQELGNKKDRKTIIATTLVLGFITIAICTFFLLKKLLNYRGNSEESNLQHTVHGMKLEELFLFKFQMLSNATGHFNLMNKLGQGGFGPVYKGKLENGQEIGVKRLARSSKQGVEEFMNEVEVISRLQHRNLVRLLGCCVESHENMLVYEYMPNGSLDAYLFDSHKGEVLEWKTRMVIIEGICRGLLYLHRDSRLRIIHRDLKASNILLDEELIPKISDFGMARIFGGKDNKANTTRVVGTYGYMSPEYALHGIFSEKSDVYSFGVLLLEIVSGRRNYHFYDEDQQLFLIAFAWKLWNEGNIINLMDPSIYDVKMETDVLRYANIALLCVQEMAEDRPNISTVLMMFGCEIAQLPCPKKPAFVGIQRLQETQFCKINSSELCSVNDVTISIVEGR